MAEQQHCNKQAQCLGGQHCSNQETKQQAWAQDEIEDGDATHVLARLPWGLLPAQRCPIRSHRGIHRSSNQIHSCPQCRGPTTSCGQDHTSQTNPPWGWPPASSQQLAAANMATDGVDCTSISRVNLFTANKSAMWKALFSTGPWQVTAACS